ncbi:MAG: hypothetical protein ACK4IY_02040 [Chitinophagales bacterium]
MANATTLNIRDKLFWTSIGIILVMFYYFIAQLVREEGYNYENFTEYRYKNKFVIYVPNYLIPDDSLNLHAQLTFSDFSNEVFLLVINESKSELQKIGIQPSAAEYYTFTKESILLSIENATITSERSNTVNGLKTLTCEINGTFAGQKVFYILSVFESDTDYYQLLAWTTDAVKNAVKRDFFAAFLTFKEI